MKKLDGKVAIITGGANGIGRAIALQFAQEGANIVITYNKNKENAIEVIKQIEKLKRKCIAVQYTAGENVKPVILTTIEKFNHIDILVNNAGILIVKSSEEMTPDIYEKTIDVNLNSTYACILQVMPYLKKQKSGKIINITSISGIVGSPTSAPYAASKAGLDAITKTLCKELGKFNIQINSIAPGPVKTQLLLNAYSKETLDKLASETPAGRIAEPEDIAKVATFFASEDSNFVNGQTLIVDGGRITI